MTANEVESVLPPPGDPKRSSCWVAFVGYSILKLGLTHTPDMVTAVGPLLVDATSVSW